MFYLLRNTLHKSPITRLVVHLMEKMEERYLVLFLGACIQL